MTGIIERLGRALRRADHKGCIDPTAPAFIMAVQCARCGEVIRSRVEKSLQVEAEYDDNNLDDNEPRPTGYILRKEMVGAKCQNLIHVVIRLDAQRMCISRQVEGGELLEIVNCD